MTAALVMSITDELVAELEKEAWLCDSDTSMFMEPAVVVALLAERAELKRDAARYRWLRYRIENKGDMVIAKCSEWAIESWSGDAPDDAIDAAMQAAQ